MGWLIFVVAYVIMAVVMFPILVDYWARRGAGPNLKEKYFFFLILWWFPAFITAAAIYNEHYAGRILYVDKAKAGNKDDWFPL